ncbi:hypothetical protein GCM10011369_10270 [Neiella marina]|uniref:SMP-30/Gluconolactonase/LRE-like region domain-containing protein n=1 Tax=Neiella marina TaxID=508461 RepID=A0A8J2U3I0_9GAMM|nr:SMP-30/gluconolactonase/LRE family protein [Neiella marina]GGA70501.1 hypothetical protein GCM10011369_10270 [Neiella marina]
MTDLKLAWRYQAKLGEGPCWDQQEQALYWLDIKQHQILRYIPATDEQKVWQFDEEITSLARSNKGEFIATNRNGFVAIDLNIGLVKPIVLPEAHMPDNRFNDAKVDGAGNLWAGSMDETETNESGALYRLSAQHELLKADSGYIISNGPAFSSDGRTMYHNDTIKRHVYAIDVDADFNLSNKRLFVQLDLEDGCPDGITVDADDHLWLAHFGGGKVSRFAPDGQLVEQITVPAPNVTSVCFGGADYRDLYITTARLLMSDQQLIDFPLAGSLFVCQPGPQGLPSNLFRG